jgi:epoxide hydrolase 4
MEGTQSYGLEEPCLEHHDVAVNGVTLHVVQGGPEKGPLVMLLHGFPEFWYGWRSQIPALATAGYRVWAPDQRGYDRSDKPPRVADYALDRLGGDVIGLIEASGRPKVYLVGHDWGAMVAWWVAGHAPQLLQRMVVINVPHGSVMARTLRRNPRQMLRSWYTLFFQLPWLPERLMSLGNWALAARALQRTSRPGTFTPADIENYKLAWSQPGAMRSMLNWYRAAFRAGRRDGIAGVPERISVPTLLIWGARDHALSRTMARPSIERCDDGHLVMIETATHWVHHEEPDRVNALITQFLADDS